MKELPTIERLKEILRLDKATGKLYNIGSRKGAVWGKEQTSIRKGYIRVKVDGVCIPAHRIVFAMVYGYWPTYEVDHKNRNTLDNRPCNLREATRLENSHNRGLHSNNTSGHPGISWHKTDKKWKVRLSINKKNTGLGTFADIEEAKIVYAKAVELHYGTFAPRARV